VLTSTKKCEERSKARLLVLTGSVSNEPTIVHIHFEGRSYWVNVGPIREYFRKIAQDHN